MDYKYSKSFIRQEAIHDLSSFLVDSFASKNFCLINEFDSIFKERLFSFLEKYNSVKRNRFNNNVSGQCLTILINENHNVKELKKFVKVFMECFCSDLDEVLPYMSFSFKYGNGFYVSIVIIDRFYSKDMKPRQVKYIDINGKACSKEDAVKSFPCDFSYFSKKVNIFMNNTDSKLKKFRELLKSSFIKAYESVNWDVSYEQKISKRINFKHLDFNQTKNVKLLNKTIAELEDYERRYNEALEFGFFDISVKHNFFNKVILKWRNRFYSQSFNLNKHVKYKFSVDDDFTSFKEVMEAFKSSFFEDVQNFYETEMAFS